MLFLCLFWDLCFSFSLSFLEATTSWGRRHCVDCVVITMEPTKWGGGVLYVGGGGGSKKGWNLEGDASAGVWSDVIMDIEEEKEEETLFSNQRNEQHHPQRRNKTTIVKSHSMCEDVNELVDDNFIDRIHNLDFNVLYWIKYMRRNIWKILIH